MSTRRQANFTSHFSIHDPLLFQSVCVNIYFYTCTHTQTHGCPALYMWNIYVSLCGFQWFPSITDDFFPQSHRRSGWNPSLRCEPVWSALSIREAVCVCVCVCECVESEAGGRSVWVHDSGRDQERDCSSAGGDPAWTQRLDVRGKTRLFTFLWLFALAVPLWTCSALLTTSLERSGSSVLERGSSGWTIR